MGNHIAYRPFHHPSVNTGKVILSDGSIHEFMDSITAAELMLEYPQQVVTEFHPSFLAVDHDRNKIRNVKPTPLPADQKLQAKKVYVMIPMKKMRGNAISGGSACTVSLSPESVRRVLSSSNAALRYKSLISLKFVPLFSRVCVRPSENSDCNHRMVKSRDKAVMEVFPSPDPDQEEEKKEFMPESMEELPDFYMSRQMSGRGWKPSLDTIKEKKIKKKIMPYSWLF